jgi:ATP synthase protein I
MNLKEFSALNVAFNILGGIVAGLFVGYMLDKISYDVFHKNTSPFFLFLFLAFGIIAGFKNAYKDFQKTLKDD